MIGTLKNSGWDTIRTQNNVTLCSDSRTLILRGRKNIVTSITTHIQWSIINSYLDPSFKFRNTACQLKPSKSISRRRSGEFSFGKQKSRKTATYNTGIVRKLVADPFNLDINLDLYMREDVVEADSGIRVFGIICDTYRVWVVDYGPSPF